MNGIKMQRQSGPPPPKKKVVQTNSNRMTGMDRGGFSIDCTFISMATVSPFANVVIDDVIVRTHKREIMKNKRGEIDVKGLAVFIVFWWWFSLDRQSFPHSILLRDAIKVERVSPLSTRIHPSEPSRQLDGKRNDKARKHRQTKG